MLCAVRGGPVDRVPLVLEGFQYLSPAEISDPGKREIYDRVRKHVHFGVSTPEQVRQTAIENEGLWRLGTPEDNAALALFLASSRAGHIQGTAIAIDGGATPGVY